MSVKKILFPTDFSTASDAALVHAENLAKQSSADLIILHIEEPPLAYGGGEMVGSNREGMGPARPFGSARVRPLLTTPMPSYSNSAPKPLDFNRFVVDICLRAFPP